MEDARAQGRGTSIFLPSNSNSNPRHLISSLITSLSPSPTTTPSATTQNPLRDLTASSKNTFLTLYALCEKELLPALDCLDRGLVTRLIFPASDDKDDRQIQFYIVRSAQQQQHHTRHGGTTQQNNTNHYYEVRLDAWNCSCPAFTFSAFPASSSSSTSSSTDRVTAAEDEEESSPDPPKPGLFFFGGLTRNSNSSPPVCKHLLACVLVQHCEKLFGGFVEEREVSREEVAGWAAGWGD